MRPKAVTSPLSKGNDSRKGNEVSMSSYGNDYCLAAAIADWAKGNAPEVYEQRQKEADELYELWQRETEAK